MPKLTLPYRWKDPDGDMEREARERGRWVDFTRSKRFDVQNGQHWGFTRNPQGHVEALLLRHVRVFVDGEEVPGERIFAADEENGEVVAAVLKPAVRQCLNFIVDRDSPWKVKVEYLRGEVRIEYTWAADRYSEGIAA